MIYNIIYAVQVTKTAMKICQQVKGKRCRECSLINSATLKKERLKKEWKWLVIKLS